MTSHGSALLALSAVVGFVGNVGTRDQGRAADLTVFFQPPVSSSRDQDPSSWGRAFRSALVWRSASTGNQRVPIVFEIEVTKDGNGVRTDERLVLPDASARLANIEDFHVIVHAHWEFDDSGYADEVGRAVAERLLQPVDLLGTQFIRAELPIHIIGYSRGAYAASAMARELVRKGLWVDHITYIDHQRFLDDGQVAAWDSCGFIDNHFQRQGPVVLSGDRIVGAYNREMTAEEVGFGRGYDLPHADVRIWYHGTIDTRVGAGDGTEEGTVTEELRRAWWSDDEERGERAGYFFSLVGGGFFVRTSDRQPRLQEGFGDRPRDGWLHPRLRSDADRESVSLAEARWPSVLWGNTDGVVGSETSIVTIVTRGAEVELNLDARAFAGTARVSVFVDRDRNPTNGFILGVGATEVPAGGWVHLQGRVDTGTLPVSGAYPLEICALIEGNGLRRHAYWPFGLHVRSSAGVLLPDRFERNESREGAVDIGTVGVFERSDLTIHDGFDQDWYTFQSSGDRVEVRVSFAHSDGDIDFVLFDEAENEVAAGRSSSDNELGVADVVEGGRYWLHVYGFAGAANRYSLSLSGSIIDEGLNPDRFEPNDSKNEAWRFGVTDSIRENELTIHDERDEDWFRVSLLGDSEIVVRVSFANSDGDIDCELTTSEVIDQGETARDEEVLTATLRGLDAVWVRVYGFDGAVNEYSMTVEVERLVDVEVEMLRGDINEDVRIDVSDVIEVLWCKFRGSQYCPQCMDAADVDDDGQVQINDAILLARYIFLAGARPAEPFLECGVDRTEDGLGCEEPSTTCR